MQYNIIVRIVVYSLNTYSTLHVFCPLHCGRLLVIVHSGCILAKWAQKTPIESHFEPLRWVEVKTFDFLKWSSLHQIMQIFTLTMMDDLFSASCLEWKCKNLDANFVSKLASKGGVPGGIRTHGLQSRSLTRYPASLRAHATLSL